MDQGLQYSDIVANQQGKSPDQLAAESNQIAQTNTLSTQNLSPQQAVPLPKLPPPVDSSGFTAGLNATGKGINDYVTSLTPVPTSNDQQQKAILDSIASLTGADTGKQEYQIQQENQLGLPDYQKHLTDINGQVQSGLAELNQMDAAAAQQNAALENNPGATASFVGGQQAAAQRLAATQRATKATEIGLLQARGLALQGQIQNAQATAARAVDLKYGPIEDQLKVRQAQLQAIQPLLDKEQKTQALAQQQLIQDKQNALQDQKEKEKQIQSVMIEAAKQGAPNDVLSSLQNAKSVEEAIGIAGYTLGNDFRLKVAQQQFDNKVKAGQLAISQANSAVERARLNLDIQKEAFDQAQKSAKVASPVMQQSTAKASIDLTNTLLTDKGLNSAVGPNYFARLSVVNQLNGNKSNFIAGVEQLRSQLNLKALEDAKANGATFGALSDQELQVLSNSATKLGAWAIKDKSGNITGYNASEKDFRSELDKINNFAKLDYVLKGGSPNDVGIKQTPDGKFWVQNSNGSFTELQ